MTHTTLILAESGGSLVFMGSEGNYLICPLGKQWELVLLVHHKSLSEFQAFTSNLDYLTIAGHRTSALEDSRLLPFAERKDGSAVIEN